MRSISVHQDGQFLVSGKFSRLPYGIPRKSILCLNCHLMVAFLFSGSDDFTARIWEISTGRCYKTFVMPEAVTCVSWCPKSDLALLAVAA